MSNEFLILLSTAAAIGFAHTIIGPDHYIPFIAIASAKKWSNYKTIFIVFLCGLGHILSSVAIGLIGIALGIAITKVTKIETTRGEIAAWLLIGLGLAYTVWGVRQSYKNKPHPHPHPHPHSHSYCHDDSHHSIDHLDQKDHSHDLTQNKNNVTIWVLFLVFIFGPCEPLIPILMYPAASNNYYMLVMLTLIFGFVTIASMILMTFLGLYGIRMINFEKFELHIHTIAGITILLCGIVIKFLNL